MWCLGSCLCIQKFTYTEQVRLYCNLTESPFLVDGPHLRSLGRNACNFDKLRLGRAVISWALICSRNTSANEISLASHTWEDAQRRRLVFGYLMRCLMKMNMCCCCLCRRNSTSWWVVTAGAAAAGGVEWAGAHTGSFSCMEAATELLIARWVYLKGKCWEQKYIVPKHACMLSHLW